MKHAFTLSALALVLVACDHVPQLTNTPLPQQAYVWQRDWTPAVNAAVSRAAPHVNGLVVLGAQISWKQGKPRVFLPDIDWKALHEAETPIGIGLRIDPLQGSTMGDEAVSRLIEVSRSLIAKAKECGIEGSEFQVDYDCPQKKLADYRVWLGKVRAALKPTRFVITTLPAWLDEPEFAKMIAEVDSYVLQVHSVTTREEGERVALCDPARANRWVAKAGALGRPFVVSLPTYSALVGYDAQGKSLGMALDGVQPAWPRGTKVREFYSDADEILGLARTWKLKHPASMSGLIFYRLPVDTDVRNWRWSTFAAVLRGDTARHELRVTAHGENPVDMTLLNTGEVDENITLPVIVTWKDGSLIASDALPGWTCEVSSNSARFVPSTSPTLRLPPGHERGIGWLRFEQRTPLHVEISR